MSIAIGLRKLFLFSALSAAFIGSAFAQTVFHDPDFVEESIGRPDSSGWAEVVGLVFADDGERGYAWERGGRVWILDDANPVSTPLIDIRDEVLGWRDFGLLGFALDPNFPVNGHIYLFYVVDRHHLEHCAEPVTGVGRPVCNASYNPNTTITATRAVIGRITRYTAIKPAGDPDFSHAVTVDYDSRKVLVGETPQTGFPILHQSHGTGHLLFGTDGTLLAASGDAASYSSTDVGSANETAWAEGLADGIIQPKENVGAYRSQLVDSLNGKIVRIDPATGDGIASNPFYDHANPRSAASRVWSLGLRNPYRMGLKPNTGSHDPAQANPGTIYIGDVGWGTWEDWHVADAPGQNFGWPAFEGQTFHNNYWNNSPFNQDASDALGCNVRFRDLIKQDTLGSSALSNPCGGGAISTFPTFVHERPKLDWRHGQDIARYPAFDTSNNPVAVTVGQPVPGTSNVLVQGSPFRGNAATGGVIYTGSDFPGDYQNTYFMGDYGSQWIRNVILDDNDNPVVVRPFISNAGGVVFITTHPTEGHLYYIRWATDLRRVDYAPGGNRPPEAVASASITYGPSPLTVNFIGDQSSDPEGTALSYEWDFGDGSAPSAAANPQHTFTAPDANPVSYTVTLTVTDSGSPANNDVDQLLISVNNTPPSVTITSPLDGTLYPITGDTVYDLQATINDTEHGAAELTCAWQTVLHHNNHTHADPVDYNCQTQTQIAPLGCGEETYFFRVHLTVTDAADLSTSAVSTLLPNCPGNNPPVANDDIASVEAFESVDINVASNDTDDVGVDLGSVTIVDQPASGSVTVQPGNGVVTYTSTSGAASTDSFSYTIRDQQGAVSNIATVTVSITNIVSAPVMNPAGGSYAMPVSVSLGSTTTAASIYYTTDGSDPSESSMLYAAGSPIQVSADTTLKARAHKAGLNPSAITVEQYTILSGQSNLAPIASVTASSEYSSGYVAAYAVDGIANGDPYMSNVEWASRRQKAGAWLDLDWGSNVYEVGQVVLYDRPNEVDQITSGRLIFSDGSTVPFGALPNDGTPLTVNFAGRSVTSLRFQIDSVSGSTKNSGLAEIEVFGEAGALAPVANDDSASVFEGQSVVIPVLDNDTADSGLDETSVTIGALPTEGSITAIDAATGIVTYTHGGGSTSVDTFTYTVRDNSGELSNAATVTIDISPYTPPTVTITNPTEGALITTPTVVANFQKSGDAAAYDHVHVRLGDDPYTAIHDLSVTSFDFGPVAPGAHSISVWLVDAGHQALTNPEATASVNFEVGVATPTISVPGGVYIQPILVELATPTAGATIHYTLDGSDPDQGAAVYDPVSPILIDSNATLRARAYLGTATPSDIASADYVFQSSLNNIAPLAVVTGSSEYSSSYAAINAVDGVASGDPFASGVEWASRREKAGAWLDLDWGGIGYLVSQVVFYDRPNTDDQVTSGTIIFSDGTTVVVDALPNDGAPLTLGFEPRATTSLRFRVDSVSGSTKNIGLAEIEVYGVLAGPQPPVADAGQDQVVVDLDGNGSASVTLDGSASSDSDGVILVYRWSVGTEVLAQDAVSSATVELPVGTHTVNLRVTDNDGLTGTDSVVITVDPQPANMAPSVNAGADKTVTVGDQLHLDDGAASDDGLPIPPGALSALWTVTDGPAMPSWPLGDQNNIHAHAVFPAVGTYTLRLTVDDGELSAYDELNVTVTGDVATPTITPAGGIYGSPVMVGMSTTTEDATVRYTLDGTDPDATSTEFVPGAPIQIDTDTTVKARAFKPGLNPSLVETVDFYFQIGVTNVAPLAANVTASSEYSWHYVAANAVDGIANGDPFMSGVEWASRREKAGAWLEMDWGGIAYEVSQIIVFDRPNTNDQVMSATISFSDGTSVVVDTLPNDGAPLIVSFAPRTVTSLRFTVDSASSSTRNIGLAEIEVYGALP